MLILRLAFVLLLYLFLFHLVSVVGRDLRAPAGERPSPGLSAAAPRGRLLVLDGGASNLRGGRPLPLREETSIGRAPSNDVQIDQSVVSARHALLRWRGSRWYLQDLASTNGTLLNREPIDGERLIEFGDVIEIGDVRLKLAP